MDKPIEPVTLGPEDQNGDPMANEPSSPELAAATIRKAQAEADKARAEASKADAEARAAILTADQQARAADPSTPEGQLAQERQLAEARKAIADAEKSTLESRFPPAASKPLEGTIKQGEKAGYLAEIVGYQALDECSAELVKDLGDLTTADVVIVDSLDVAQDDFPLVQATAQFNLLRKQLEGQKESLEEVRLEAAPKDKLFAPMAVIPALVAATSVAGHVADLLGYFRTDYTLTPRDFALSDTSLKACVAGKIDANSVRILNFQLVEKSQIYRTFVELTELRAEVDAVKDEVVATVLAPAKTEAERIKVEIQRLEKQLDDATPGKRAEIEKRLDEKKVELVELTGRVETVEGKVARWQSLSASCDVLFKSLVTPGEDMKAPVLVLAAAREQIRNTTHVLHVKMASSGGESITGRSLFFPWRMGTVSYLGGCATSYFMASKDGELLSSGTLTALCRVEYNLRTGSIRQTGKIQSTGSQKRRQSQAQQAANGRAGLVEKVEPVASPPA